MGGIERSSRGLFKFGMDGGFSTCQFGSRWFYQDVQNLSLVDPWNSITQN